MCEDVECRELLVIEDTIKRMQYEVDLLQVWVKSKKRKKRGTEI